MSKSRTRGTDKEIGETKNRRTVICTLSNELVAEVRRFASLYYEGNSDNLVEAALRSYFVRLRKELHTAKMRDSYAAASTEGRKVAADWDSMSTKVWPCVN